MADVLVIVQRNQTNEILTEIHRKFEVDILPFPNLYGYGGPQPFGLHAANACDILFPGRFFMMVAG